MKVHPLLGRALAIGGVALLILLPLVMIEGKVNERRQRADGVERQFAAETSGPQTVAGPFLALTCEETWIEERVVQRGGKAETVSERRTGPCPTAYYPPRSLRVGGKLPVEDLHRGIYPIRLYRAALDLSGELEWPAPAESDPTHARTWKQAYLVASVSDPRGIKAIGGSHAQTRGKLLPDGRFAFQADLGPYEAKRAGEKLPFALQLQLTGTGQIGIAPVGDATEIRLASNWRHPSFAGRHAPDERRVSAEGFEAIWRTTLHATGGQPAWEKRARENQLDQPAIAASVSLVDPVNVYALSYRAVEYGFLFVLFTFTALAFAEVMAGIRLHVVQYLLVGAALAVFFLLLIALSEHIAFAQAYAAAATACVTLLTFYLRYPLGTRARTVAFFALLTGLYGTLFVLLRSEDHALLMGSLLVFAALAVLMVVTRRIDWSAFGRAPRAPAPA